MSDIGELEWCWVVWEGHVLQRMPIWESPDPLRPPTVTTPQRGVKEERRRPRVGRRREIRPDIVSPASQQLSLRQSCHFWDTLLRKSSKGRRNLLSPDYVRIYINSSFTYAVEN